MERRHLSFTLLWYTCLVFGIIVFLLAVNVNHVQKLILKKAERLLDESIRTGIVEYHYSVDGIEIISQLAISKNY